MQHRLDLDNALSCRRHTCNLQKPIRIKGLTRLSGCCPQLYERFLLITSTYATPNNGQMNASSQFGECMLKAQSCTLSAADHTEP